MTRVQWVGLLLLSVWVASAVAGLLVRVLVLDGWPAVDWLAVAARTAGVVL